VTVGASGESVEGGAAAKPAASPTRGTPTAGSRGLWPDTLPDGERWRGAPLDGDVDVDVAVVGGGLTGLWTAWHLRQLDPSLRIAVLERETVGFGASGRNGGWCSALLPMSHRALVRRHGRDATMRLQRAMYDNVAEIGRFVHEHAGAGAPEIFHHGGTIDLARNRPQEDRLREHVAELHQLGSTDDDLRWVDADEARAICNATQVRGAAVTPHCAAVHPLRLTHLVARAASGAGVSIHEHTRVERIDENAVRSDRGTVRAEIVVRATEGYTCGLPGERRTYLPIYSMMIATEPLSADTWGAIGLAGRPTFADDRHMVVYGQRTADDRLAFGGRGAPYHFGSAVRPEFDTDDRVRRLLTATLRDLFPVLADVGVTHHWGGVLAAPRDWTCSVRFDRRTGRASAGGYVGDGLATTHLAGRTLAALVVGHDDEVVRLPWVGHRSRAWEPEPLRWLGVNAARLAAARADEHEHRRDRPSRLWDGVMSTLLRR
jgi:glycine/D-amino acid oxidase-like deaminating enzyme